MGELRGRRGVVPRLVEDLGGKATVLLGHPHGEAQEIVEGLHLVGGHAAVGLRDLGGETGQGDCEHNLLVGRGVSAGGLARD